MRLLIVSQYFWPENFRINDLCAELVARGHQVTVLTGWPNYPDGQVFEAYRQQPQDFQHYAGAELVRVPLLPRGRGGPRLFLNFISFALSASLIGAWKLRGRPFDAQLVFEPSPVTVGLPAVLQRALKKTPLAFWVLDLWPETLAAVGVLRSPTLLRAVGQLVRFIYRRCDLLLASSQSFIPSIRQYTRPEQDVRYFPNWSDPWPSEADLVPAPELPAAPGVFTVLFAGNLGEAQDFPAVLAAAQQARQAGAAIRWVILGDGRMGDWIRDEVQRLGLNDCVQMLGRFPSERMPSFFMQADALLVSLKRDPIFAMTVPAKLQSYLAAGRPVLAMLDGEGAALVRSTGVGLACAAGDAAGLAAAAQHLAALPLAQRQAMGQAGQRLTAERFDRVKLIDQLEQALQTLAGPAARAPSP